MLTNPTRSKLTNAPVSFPSSPFSLLDDCTLAEKTLTHRHTYSSSFTVTGGEYFYFSPSFPLSLPLFLRPTPHNTTRKQLFFPSPSALSLLCHYPCTRRYLHRSAKVASSRTCTVYTYTDTCSLKLTICAFPQEE